MKNILISLQALLIVALLLFIYLNGITSEAQVVITPRPEPEVIKSVVGDLNIQLATAEVGCYEQVRTLVDRNTELRNQYENLSWVCSNKENPLNTPRVTYIELENTSMQYGCVDKKYLKNSTIIDWNQEMQSQADECIQKDRLDQIIFCLSDLTRAELNYTYGMPDTIPAMKLDGSGDCTDFAKLFCAYARSVSIPCRVILGKGVNTTNYLHHWSEVEYFTDGSYGWLVIDTTERFNSTNINDSPDPFSSQAKYVMTREEEW